MPQSSAATQISNCDIVRILSAERNPAVTIRCPSGPPLLLGIAGQKELTSTDLGHSWREGDPLHPVPYSATLPDGQLIQSPSSSSIQYRRLQDIGLYLRSEDAGQTWLLPEFKIEGESREQAFSRLGVTKFYTIEFHLLAIHSREPRHLYARIFPEPWAAMIWIAGPLTNIEVPGVYESTDGGENWQKVRDTPVGTTTLGISSANPSLLYAHGAAGVFKSENAGKEWSIVGENDLLIKQPLTTWDEDPKATEPAPRINFETYQFVLDPQDPEVVFIVSNKGFYRSMNGGKTWCLLNLGFDEIGSTTSLAFNPERPAEIFLGTSRGVFHSKDRGAHIEKIFPKK
jgi:hypothetical protein